VRLHGGRRRRRVDSHHSMPFDRYFNLHSVRDSVRWIVATVTPLGSPFCCVTLSSRPAWNCQPCPDSLLSF
jgi:hypothetical protein